MPVQQTCFGHPIRLQMPPRRFQMLIGIVLFLVVTLTLYGPPSSADIPTMEQVKETIKNPSVPSLPGMGPVIHKPASQRNSTAPSSYGLISWLTDFHWRNPFSSSVTMDEDRALLPPLKPRPSIYTYYEPANTKDKAVSAAEHRLLLAWRRAWWAQGFLPQVLSSDEAEANERYRIVQRWDLDPNVRSELMRWLAWEYVGGGILTNWLALPMATSDNPLLAHLRRNEYQGLTRVEGLHSAIFYAPQKTVTDVLKRALDSPPLKNVTENKQHLVDLHKKEGGVLINLLSSQDVEVTKKSGAVAYYSKDVISTKYQAVADKLTNITNAEGLDTLATLINSHLHVTFQNVFKDGVVVVKPLPEHTSALMGEAVDIARNLTQCPTSPIPDSCPPNNKDCRPCNPANPLPLKFVASYKNTSTMYSVGAVPHPYTLTSLHHQLDSIDRAFLRRKQPRDQWITAVTLELLGDKVSGEHRVVHFKETVAAPSGRSNSLWLTAERPTQDDLDWIFGFNLPQESTDKAPTGAPVPGPQPRPAMPTPLKDVLSNPEQQAVEQERLHKAREAIKSSSRHMRPMVEMVEKWNLYDTEAWKFARAWSARRRIERKSWEEDERKFAGTEKKAGVHSGSGGGRWSD